MGLRLMTIIEHEPESTMPSAATNVAVIAAPGSVAKTGVIPTPSGRRSATMRDAILALAEALSVAAFLLLIFVLAALGSGA